MCKGDANVSDMGKRVVLPTSFTGGHRYMRERTRDAMTYVRHYGRPDLFITFTCNPSSSQPVSYTHLDVYKRQNNRKYTVHNLKCDIYKSNIFKYKTD